MNAISSPANSSTNTTTVSTMVNYDNNELIDFVEFSNLNFNNKLINKYQDRVNKTSEVLITSLLTLDEGDDVDDDGDDDDDEEYNEDKLTKSNSTTSTKQVEISDEISKYTTYIELEKIIFEKKLLELIIHFNILNKLEKHRVINWHSSTALFYPIKTVGDGNCLVNIHSPSLSSSL